MGDSSDNPRDDDYHGTGAVSEQETTIISEYIKYTMTDNTVFMIMY